MTASRPPLAEWRNDLRDSDLDRGAKLVGHTIATYANGSGTCYPSRATIAAGASVSVDTVDRAVAELDAAGFLIVSRSKGRTANGYELSYPTAAGEPPLEESNSRTRETVGARQRSQNEAPTAAPDLPESVKNAKTSTGAGAPTRDRGRAQQARLDREEAASRELAYLD